MSRYWKAVAGIWLARVMSLISCVKAAEKRACAVSLPPPISSSSPRSWRLTMFTFSALVEFPPAIGMTRMRGSAPMFRMRRRMRTCASGEAVTLDVNASVKSLVVDGGSSVDATGFQLASAGDIKFDGGAISQARAGVSRPTRSTAIPRHSPPLAGSTVEFNNFTRGASSATAATFNGNVKIGVGDSENACDLQSECDCDLERWPKSSIESAMLSATDAAGDRQRCVERRRATSTSTR